MPIQVEFRALDLAKDPFFDADFSLITNDASLSKFDKLIRLRQLHAPVWPYDWLERNGYNGVWINGICLLINKQGLVFSRFVRYPVLKNGDYNYSAVGTQWQKISSDNFRTIAGTNGHGIPDVYGEALKQFKSAWYQLKGRLLNEIAASITEEERADRRNLRSTHLLSMAIPHMPAYTSMVDEIAAMQHALANGTLDRNGIKRVHEALQRCLQANSHMRRDLKGIEHTFGEEHPKDD